MDKLSYRKGVYAILAELLKEPTPEMIGELPAMAGYLDEALKDLGYEAALPDWREWTGPDRDAAALAADYNRSFVFPPATRVVPVESVYRQWTCDPGAKVPFAREKGYLMSDSALHMKALYDGYGLEPPPDFGAAPDHLCLELEFMCFLLENESPERQGVFAREHLDWVDELARDAVTAAIPLFYRQVLALAAEFLRAEREQYG